MKRILFLVTSPSFGAAREHAVLSGFDRATVLGKCGRVGIPQDLVQFDAISRSPRYPDAGDFISATQRINAQDFDTIIPLDEGSLKFLTGKNSIRKWHMSPLDSYETFRCRKVMPSFHPDLFRAEYHLNVYLELALGKVKRFLGTDQWPRKEKRFHLNPSVDEAIAILESIRHEPWHSLDIETGNNQINTWGVAWSRHDALAIKVLPEGIPDAAYHKLWKLIAEICEGDSAKVMQNGIYERMYHAAYGIYIRNFRHDTMCAMRLLNPELEKGLDNVGRLYTDEPYWKDDGKVHTAEGAKKDWANIRDWNAHFDYNAKDTSGTFEAMENQRIDLESRGLLDVHDNYVVRLFDPICEMSCRGLPINLETQKRLIAEYEARVTEIIAGMSQKINHKSPKQKIKLLTDKGIELPKKRNKKKGGYADSADELTLKKARLKNPSDPDIKALLDVAGVEKALSSYLRVQSHPDKRIRFTLDPFATETGRMCLTGDAEILTLKGWTALEDWNPEIPILQWARTGEISWCHAKKHEFTCAEPLVSIDSAHIKLNMTKEHRVPVSNYGKFEVIKANQLKARQNNIPICGTLMGEFEAEIRTRILVMVQADGSFRREKSHHNWAVRLSFTKIRKIERCRTLLKRGGIRNTETVTGKYINFYINVPDMPHWLTAFHSKLFDSWLLNHDPKVFIDELVHWDGNYLDSLPTSFIYTTCVRQNAEWVQTMAHLAGKSASIGKRPRKHMKDNWSDSYKVRVRSYVTHRISPTILREMPFKGQVYCPETDTGFFVVRNQGCISITGNSCRKDPWDKGFNAQTMNDYTKHMVEWPAGSDRVFVEIDLSQAESRFVAYDAQEDTLLEMLENKRDVHRYVAAEIYKKPMAEITHEERQLGKRSGHGANYAMGAQTFMDSCLKDMDLILDRKTATNVLEAYHRVFPKIRAWHERIRNEVYTKRKLTNPLGLERFFFGRLSDDTYREAYAYRPQSSIPIYANHMIFTLCELRKQKNLDLWLHSQCHDSVTISCASAEVPIIAESILNIKAWQPKVILPAGQLYIPVDIKSGPCLGKLVKYG